MENLIKIYCRNTDSYISVPGGSNLIDVYRLLKDKIDFEPINAFVNNKSEALTFPLYSPKTVEFIPVTSASGNRTYVRSLCMMLYHAVASKLPGARLRIEHSLANGYYGTIDMGGSRITSPEVIKALEEHIRSLVEKDLPFKRKEDRTENVIEIFRNQGLDDKVKLLSTLHELYTVYYTLDGLSDSYYGPLAASTGILKTFRLIPFNNGLLLLGAGQKQSVGTGHSAAPAKNV